MLFRSLNQELREVILISLKYISMFGGTSIQTNKRGEKIALRAKEFTTKLQCLLKWEKCTRVGKVEPRYCTSVTSC